MTGDSVLKREFETTLDGKPVTLRRPTLAMELAYVKHLRKRAVAELAADLADLKDAPDELRGLYVEMRKDVANNITEGRYDWGATGFYASLGSPRNQQAFVHLWLRDNAAQMNGAMITEEKLAQLWPTHRGPLNDLITEVLTDPNSGAARPDPPGKESA